MNTDKINFWVVGLCSIFAGGTLIYLEGYKNNEIIETFSYLLLYGGVICVFVKSVKGTITDAPKILYKDDKPGFFKQRIIKFFAYLLLVGVIFGSIFWLESMGRKRKADILQNQPTDTTVAVIDHIDIRHGRHSTYYYAVFQYTVNGKMISHPWSEDENEFLEGQKFEIKYSVTHPHMFMLIRQVQ